MNKVIGYQCSICDRSYALDEVTYTCPDDGGNLTVVLDYGAINANTSPDVIHTSQARSMWRYLPLLPVGPPGHASTPLHAVGWTSTFRPPQLSQQTGIKQLWIKDESRNPTASFKDRASALLVVRAAEIDAEITVTASTGNAGAALAGMSAATGRKAIIFAPQTAPAAKVAQLLVFGAEVILVDGSYDDAFDLSVEASNEFGWYNRNTGYNPFTAEGKKTAAFEIWEQVILLNELERPLNIFVSVGDGNIISGIHKGFKDLYALGWLEQMPRIFGVQSEGSAAIYNAYAGGTENILAVSASTLADSISVDLPRDGLRALRAATQTDGAYIRVSDEAIVSAIAHLGTVGVFAEPAGAAAYAGVLSALDEGQITKDDAVLAVNTGSGLKDVNAAMQAVRQAPIIKPNLDAVKEVLR